MSDQPLDIDHERKRIERTRWVVTCLIALPFAIAYWWPDGHWWSNQPRALVGISWALAAFVFFMVECHRSRLEGYEQGYSQGFGDRGMGQPNRLTNPTAKAPNPPIWTWVPALLPLAIWVTLGVAIWRGWI